MRLDLSNLNEAAPLIADLIDTAEDKFATGPERHRWVRAAKASAPVVTPSPETVDQELKKIGRKRRTRRAKPSES